MLKDSKSRPINLNDEIVPRVVPFDHKSITTYGKRFGFLFLEYLLLWKLNNCAICHCGK